MIPPATSPRAVSLLMESIITLLLLRQTNKPLLIPDPGVELSCNSAGIRKILTQPFTCNPERHTPFYIYLQLPRLVAQETIAGHRLQNV